MSNYISYILNDDQDNIVDINKLLTKFLDNIAINNLSYLFNGENNNETDEFYISKIQNEYIKMQTEKRKRPFIKKIVNNLAHRVHILSQTKSKQSISLKYLDFACGNFVKTLIIADAIGKKTDIYGTDIKEWGSYSQ